jgi:hypothetical protein
MSAAKDNLSRITGAGSGDMAILHLHSAKNESANQITLPGSSKRDQNSGQNNMKTIE